MDSKHLHSTGNLVERIIDNTYDVLALGEKFNDVLVLSKNTGNLVERSIDNTDDALALGEKFDDGLVLSKKWLKYS